MTARPRESERGATPSLRLVFMGTPAFAAVSLERLLGGPHEVVAVVTRPDRPAGRGHKLHASAVKELALGRAIEVLEPASARDPSLVDRLRELAPDLAVVVAYGRILPRTVIDIPRLGCINAHASLLPLLRGAAPIERAILAGLDETGVTIMRINERMDAGDMIDSRAVAIGRRTDGGELREVLAQMSADLLASVVDQLARGEAVFTPQDEDAATYAPPIDKAEARIDWSAPARDIERKVRAFRPRPGAYTFDEGRRLKLLAASVAEPAAGQPPATLVGIRGDAVLVACGEGALLVETVQPEGKRPMAAGAYLRGSDGPLPRRLADAAKT